MRSNHTNFIANATGRFCVEGGTLLRNLETLLRWHLSGPTMAYVHAQQPVKPVALGTGAIIGSMCKQIVAPAADRMTVDRRSTTRS